MMYTCAACGAITYTDRPTPACPRCLAPRKRAKVHRRDDDARIRTLELGSVAVREGDGDDGRTLTGYAYRWGDLAHGTQEYPDAAEGFERGAFASLIASRAGRPFPYLARHRGTVVGGVTLTEDEIGLRFDGRLLDTQAARDYAAEASVADGVSLEFIPGQIRRQGRRVMHTMVRAIAGLAGVYAPAYAGATVAIREGGSTMHTCPHCGVELTPGVGHDCQAQAQGAPATQAAAPLAIRAEAGAIALTTDQIRALATDAATEVMRAYAERGQISTSASDPLAGYRNLGELFLAASLRDAEPELRAYAARALADTVFTAGANAGLASGNLVTQEIRGLVERGRRAITAFGGPRPLGDMAGLTVSWPYYDGTLTDHVAAQSAEKAEIESAAVDIKLATEALVTYAGGSDISNQLIRRGSPSILDAFARIMLAAWGVVTDAAFVTELETGTVNVDTAEAISAHDLTEYTADFVTASVAIDAATGQGVEFILASTTAFTRLAQLIAPSSLTLVGAGSMDLAGLRISVANVPILHVPGVTAGKVIASNRLAAAWYEDGPFQASAEDVAKLGRNVAYWSMGAGARFVPAGIIEIFDVTP